MDTLAANQDTLLVDGARRSRSNAEGLPIDVSEAGLVAFWRWFGDSVTTDALGRPIPMYHGTASTFDRFSHDEHRSVLNNNYQGDGFHFSPDLDVADRYSTANRNQLFNKKRMFAAIDQVMPELIAATFKNVVEAGYQSAWDLPDEQVDVILACASQHGIDINSLLDLAEYVEGSNYNKGLRTDTASTIFDAISGGGAIYLPEWAATDARSFGLGSAVPEPRVVAAYLKTYNPLHTNRAERAKKAADRGFDGLCYSGNGTVANVPEWVVFEPTQIKSIFDYGRWLASDNDYQTAGAPSLVSERTARSLLLRTRDDEGTDLPDPLRRDDGTGWVLVSIPTEFVTSGARTQRPPSGDTCASTPFARKDSPIVRLGIDIASVRDGNPMLHPLDLKPGSLSEPPADGMVKAVIQRSHYMLMYATHGLTLARHADHHPPEAQVRHRRPHRP